MTNIINTKRINQITTFLKSLNIKSERFSEIIETQNISVIQNFNQAFIHSSENKIINYEKLEFFGDAVLRLAASNFIEKKYPKMNVGERSELRAQIVSDEWLTKMNSLISLLMKRKSITFIVGEQVGWSLVSEYKIGNTYIERIGELQKRITKISKDNWLALNGRAIKIDEISIEIPT